MEDLKITQNCQNWEWALARDNMVVIDILISSPSFHIPLSHSHCSAGTNTHGRDFRKSAGAFIHGFRYTGMR